MKCGRFSKWLNAPQLIIMIHNPSQVGFVAFITAQQDSLPMIQFVGVFS